jgi:16S rRNA (cytosine967-C5)-methyltransferase
MRKARIVAIDALERIEGGAFAHVMLPTQLRASGLDARDRSFVTFVVYGTVREQRRLDALLAPRTHQPLDRLEPRVRAALRLGAFQLLHGTPAHAAVSETVGAAPPRARGLVNAVLRSVAAEGPPFPEPDHLGVRYSYPDWIVQELAATVPADELPALLAAGNEPAAVTLRPNHRVANADELDGELRATGVEVERGALVPDALIVRGIGDPVELAAVTEGRATPQDQGSQAVVDVLDPRPGDRVLDVAAAPGGKATAIAERVRDGFVCATDVHPGRLRLVAEAATRLRLANVACVVADGRGLPVRAAAFDRVLVDAPCSGLGVLRRRPEARWRITRDDVPRLVELQRALLREASHAVAPGGLLVYAVCTLTAAETSGIADWSVANLEGFTVEARPGPPWEAGAHGAVLLPHRAGTDGMFVLPMRRAV